ncbi:4-alpha-glucanotransferase [Stakelama pacifica]|uniref:4-alpha-glucanotransferase n=1 Tax=Stakelama pacifica TaxID=517720 RepID=A0A4R6FXA7_9SPHN|nr:4-alpha-glucanotransferase [Stakelama pacifica]TDN86573.1 4-alpha-glucanotransferase [Stakelama pacifica]
MAFDMKALHRLCAALGVQIDWENAEGKAEHVSDDSLRRILSALGYPAEDDAALRESVARLQERQLPDFLTGDQDEMLLIPGDDAGGIFSLELENGTVVPIAGERTSRGLLLDPIDVPGYHRLRVTEREITLAIAPHRCFGMSDVAPKRRLWGPSVQVPALRGEAPGAFGDFATLEDAARAFGAKGADAMAISPTHALFPADPSRFSPYAPSSRMFHNILFGDLASIEPQLREVAGGELIDWAGAIPARLAALRRAFDARGDTVREAVERYRAAQGKELERHALFDALHAHFFAQGARGWQEWPERYRDPDSPAVAAFSDEHRGHVDFYIFAQWLAESSLKTAQRAATDAGMAIGLISDLAVGMDMGGSHGWSRREDLLNGLSIGAPPDPLGPAGQDWRITSFAPDALRRTGFRGFIDTLRAAIRNTGGIRIDHVLGLRRLWVVPHGASSAQGAYLTMPLDDMLRIIALESQRAKAVVIGEDLGTVPEGLRPQLAKRGLMGMRVLWFERDAKGAFLPPETWASDAVAMSGTHDTPTAAGWWQGRDIDWRERTGQSTEAANKDRLQRRWERKRLWDACTRAGVAEGPQPAPEASDPIADAALGFVAATPCNLAIVPLEDVAALVEQPNLPGTTDEHPNWRRRMPEATDTMLAEPRIAARIERLNKERRS